MGNSKVSMQMVNQLLKTTIETNQIDAYFDKFYHSEYNYNNNNSGCIKIFALYYCNKSNIIPP